MIAAQSTYVPRLLPLRMPRLCVAVASPDAEELIAKAESLVRDNPLLELRLDYLPQPATVFPKIKRLLDSQPGVILIATCRRAVNGGKFRGSVERQLAVLTKAAASGCQIVDLELQSALAARRADLQRLRSRAALLLSFHDFRATRKLDETFQKMAAIPAEFYKLVTTATSLYDNVVMMKFLEQKSQQHSIVGLCMGEQGIISRVLGVRAGSIFTFAAAGPGEETAPGQISARALRDTYRIEQVDAATRVYGVAGDPVAHSLSPLAMNTAFRRENVSAVYLALHAKTLEDLLACVREIPLHGLSITMPYKESMVKHLDNSDAYTTRVGACNTVVRGPDGKLYGFNTDVAGVLRPLEQRLPLENAKVLVLGAGGAARAAVFGLKEHGAEVYILNRTPAPAQKLARKAHARLARRPDLKKMTFDVIINATPMGMDSSKDTPLGEGEINSRYLLEMVYSPAETHLVKMARAKGVQIIPGAEMFVQQAARQFEIWTGKPAPVAEMQRVVDRGIQEAAAAHEQKTRKKASP
ncbi:MAG TPA: shikimate dehydrogenase [Terriglobales bacterium]|jgi:3-dehydroquinate dehydratase / shikimate dehydrogenase|nr:shikimate dehydrogenase [Terriglobales bacterium]